MSLRETWAALPKANRRAATVGAIFAVWGLVLIVSSAAKDESTPQMAFHSRATYTFANSTELLVLMHRSMICAL
jgi:hypothetical protein